MVKAARRPSARITEAFGALALPRFMLEPAPTSSAWVREAFALTSCVPTFSKYLRFASLLSSSSVLPLETTLTLENYLFPSFQKKGLLPPPSLFFFACCSLASFTAHSQTQRIRRLLASSAATSLQAHWLSFHRTSPCSFNTINNLRSTWLICASPS